MILSWEREASGSLVQLRHVKGSLLSYFLAPGTGNLHLKEVVTQVLQENWEKHERTKEKARASLNHGRHRRTQLTWELDELSQGFKAAADGKAWEEIEERMGVLRTTLEKVESSITKNKDWLEEGRMHEDEAQYGDWDLSDSSEEHEGDVMVEGLEETGPPGTESTDPLRSQEAVPSMEVDTDQLPLLTSGDTAMVTTEEEGMLMGDPSSMTGELARLQISSLDSPKPEGGETA